MSSRILLLGTGPLLEPGTRVMSGQCLRTWHFTAPLREAGHEVRLLTVPIPNTTRDEAPVPVEPAEYLGFGYRKFLSNDAARILPLIREEIAAFKPDALIGVNAYPAFLLALLDTGIPFWADLNGWTMAEGLIRSAALGHANDFGHFWRIEALPVLRADAFSTVTDRQGYALLGEMAMLGRQVIRTDNLVYTVPNAVHPDYARIERRPGVPGFLRDRLPADAAICLWCGGFNSWTDVPTLVEGLARAMEMEPRLAFVCTGGRIHGHDEKTYEEFCALADARLPAGRVLRLGWVDYDQVLELHATANAGINMDGANIETVFGARNRLTNLLGAGVPVLTTRGTEIAQWIGENEAGYVFAAGSPEELALALRLSVAESRAWQAKAEVARSRALEDFKAANTLKGFLDWCTHPKPNAEKCQSSLNQSHPVRNLQQLASQLALQQPPFQWPIDPSQPHPPSEQAPGLRRILRKLTGGTH